MPECPLLVRPDGPRRRWVTGQEETASPAALDLLRRSGTKRRRWQSAKRFAPAGHDQIDGEVLLRQLARAGLVAIHERIDRRGEWEPYEWEPTAAGLATLKKGEATTLPSSVEAFLERAEDTTHPVVRSIAAWFAAEPWTNESETFVRLLLAVGQAYQDGLVPHERTLALRLGRTSKGLRLAQWAERLEAITGVPLAGLVPPMARAALVYGPFTFDVEGRTIDGLWSRPWLALTAETIETATNWSTSARRLLTIENQMPFEREVRQGLPENTVALYTGGFVGRAELRCIERFCAAGIEHIDHWSDLDLGGLRILHHLATEAPVSVTPFRMEPELLEHLPTIPLSSIDRAGLQRWLDDESLPARALARRMLATDRKAEQEGWYLASVSPQV